MVVFTHENIYFIICSWQGSKSFAFKWFGCIPMASDRKQGDTLTRTLFHTCMDWVLCRMTDGRPSGASWGNFHVTRLMLKPKPLITLRATLARIANVSIRSPLWKGLSKICTYIHTRPIWNSRYLSRGFYLYFFFKTLTILILFEHKTPGH